jgi:hypothetical protein
MSKVFRLLIPTLFIIVLSCSKSIEPASSTRFEGSKIILMETKDEGDSWSGSIKTRVAADDPSTAFIANDII